MLPASGVVGEEIEQTIDLLIADAPSQVQVIGDSVAVVYSFMESTIIAGFPYAFPETTERVNVFSDI